MYDNVELSALGDALGEQPWHKHAMGQQSSSLSSSQKLIHDALCGVTSTLRVTPSPGD